MSAGFRRDGRAVVWVAAPPDGRFPYLPQALCDLGAAPSFRGDRLWAFFDSAYRSRADSDYLAARWRRAGIAALHVAAWHFFEPDRQQDEYLVTLIRACHRQGILVYAWFELPHVSEKFWADHPEWREKTAILQDARLDWRKLMNLANRDCFRAVSAGVRQLAARFDWDGLNLAELYFESLEGAANPARFTPMNPDVRGAFRAKTGSDPIDRFQNRAFLDFRSDLAFRMQQEWLAQLEEIRRSKPYLDLVLTHVDDRFDSGMRDAIGADAARVLPLLDKHAFTFLIEDPATVWNLGAGRYRTIAERYAPLTPHHEKLAIDLNIVERYQDVYPTKQQTGSELFEMLHSAAANFGRVALYFESSLLPPDLPLLPAASATTRLPYGIPWKGPATVDGAAWPAADGDTVWLPAGPHKVAPAAAAAGPHLLRLTADLKSARYSAPSAIEFSYEASARAIAILDRRPLHISVDGSPSTPQLAAPQTVLLPPGRHTVVIRISGMSGPSVTNPPE
jgi:hypothetical protein